MKNLYLTEADFRQERDFGQKINATFEFIGAHFRPLGRCLFYIVMPAALVAGVGLGFLQVGLGRFSEQLGRASARGTNPFANNPALSGGAVPGLILILLGALAAYLLVSATVYGYIRVRLELPAAEQVQPGQVWQVIRRTLPRAILYSIGLAPLVGVAFLLFFIPGFYLAVALTFFVPILFFEGTGFSATLSRCLYLVKGKWWSTFGLLFVTSFIQNIAGYVFQIPAFVVGGAKGLHLGPFGSDTALLVAQSFASVAQILLYVIGLVAAVFQYFNLVEKKDGLGLRGLVAQLGQAPAAVRNETYRPDEEGEY